MRILLVHPGASWSTADVYNGYLRAMARHPGLEVEYYALDGRIAASSAWLAYLYKRAQRLGRETEKPHFADAILHAGQDVLGRALRAEVDWVVVISGMYLHPDWVILLRRAGIKVAVLLTESPYDDEQQGRFIEHVNLAWTNERTSASYLRQWNREVHYLPHAYDPGVHAPGIMPHGPIERASAETAIITDQEIPAHDVFFVGTGFIERQRLLEGVNWDGIDLGLYGSWDLMGSRNRLRRHLDARLIDNRETVLYYRRAKIGLNLYRTSMGWGRDARQITDAESLNPRAVELAACGCFHLSNWRTEVAEVFGDLVPTFETAKELEDLIWYYLERPEERARIAGLLPARVAHMTFDARVEQMLADLARYSGLRAVERPALVPAD